VFPVRYELGFISQKTAFFVVTAMKILSLHSINRLGSVAETQCVSCEVRTGILYPRNVILPSHRRENIKSYSLLLTGLMSLRSERPNQGRAVCLIRGSQYTLNTAT
jgi:hypothetical protein